MVAWTSLLSLWLHMVVVTSVGACQKADMGRAVCVCVNQLFMLSSLVGGHKMYTWILITWGSSALIPVLLKEVSFNNNQQRQ